MNTKISVINHMMQCLAHVIFRTSLMRGMRYARIMRYVASPILHKQWILFEEPLSILKYVEIRMSLHMYTRCDMVTWWYSMDQIFARPWCELIIDQSISALSCIIFIVAHNLNISMQCDIIAGSHSLRCALSLDHIQVLKWWYHLLHYLRPFP